MDHIFDFGSEDQANIVYIRPVRVNELPPDVRLMAGNAKTIFAVHNAEGERLALVRDRKLAFVLARQHDMSPVSVH